MPNTPITRDTGFVPGPLGAGDGSQPQSQNQFMLSHDIDINALIAAIHTLYDRLGLDTTAADWATFTGSTISDNLATLPELLQELETAIEAGGGGTPLADNFVSADLVLAEARTHDLAGNDLTLGDAGTLRLDAQTLSLGDGTGANLPPDQTTETAKLLSIDSATGNLLQTTVSNENPLLAYFQGWGGGDREAPVLVDVLGGESAVRLEDANTTRTGVYNLFDNLPINEERHIKIQWVRQVGTGREFELRVTGVTVLNHLVRVDLDNGTITNGATNGEIVEVVERCVDDTTVTLVLKWQPVGTGGAWEIIPAPDTATDVGVLDILELDLNYCVGEPPLVEDNIRATANFDKFEYWVKIGQSNSVGFGANDPPEQDGLDAPDVRVLEVSQGVSRNNSYRAAPVGTPQTFRAPSQDNGSGINFSLHFGKARVDFNPGIEKLAISSLADGGSGFSNNRWNPGDDLYNAVIAEATQFLIDHPDYIFAGIINHQGEADAGMSQADYQNAQIAMVEGILAEVRAVAPGRVRGRFIQGTQVEAYIQASEGTRRPIDNAHRNTASYLPDATFADLSDLVDNGDGIHFDTPSTREMGRRYAVAAQELAPTRLSDYRLKVQGQKVVDLYSNCGVVYEPVFFNDPDRGYVLDTQNFGFNTNLELSRESYTKACWVNVKQAPPAFGNLLSGWNSSDGHYWAWNGLGHGNPVTQADRLRDVLDVGVWAHVILTWDGQETNVYKDGVLVQTNPLTLLPPIVPQEVSIGSINGSNQLDAYVDDVVILPYALSTVGVATLYNQALNPPEFSEDSLVAVGGRVYKAQITDLDNGAPQEDFFTTAGAGDYRLFMSNRTAGSGNCFARVYSDAARTIEIASNISNRLQADASGEGTASLLIEDLAANTNYFLKYEAGGGSGNIDFIATIHHDELLMVPAGTLEATKALYGDFTHGLTDNVNNWVDEGSAGITTDGATVNVPADSGKYLVSYSSTSKSGGDDGGFFGGSFTVNGVNRFTITTIAGNAGGSTIIDTTGAPAVLDIIKTNGASNIAGRLTVTPIPTHTAVRAEDLEATNVPIIQVKNEVATAGSDYSFSPFPLTFEGKSLVDIRCQAQSSGFRGTQVDPSNTWVYIWEPTTGVVELNSRSGIFAAAINFRAIATYL